VLKEPPFEESAEVAAMGQPRVAYLRYRLLPRDEATEFQAPPLHIERDEFDVYVGPEGKGVRAPFASVSTSLAGSETTRIRRDVEALVTFKADHQSEREAHEAVRPFLEAWLFSAALEEPGRPQPFSLEFAGSLIVDSDPPPGQDAKYVVSGGGSFYVRPPEQQIVIETFGEPPERFAADRHVITLWRRWKRYLDGKDTLAAAAYACLTYVENEVAQGEREAAANLRVSRRVLQTIGRLTSNVGDEETARKFDPGPRRAHTAAEVAFLEAAITALIRRVGEVAAGGATELQKIGLADLPRP
jgi:hypothetical protein